MSVELFNGIITPDGKKVPFAIPLEGVRAVDLKTINHPAFDYRGSKGLVATEKFAPGDYIGSYGGRVCYFSEDDDADQWNPYQLTPDPDGNYYIDGLYEGNPGGNELRYCNDPRGTDRQPNAKFYQSDSKVAGFYVCDVYAIAEIKPGDEILVSYGDGYWEMLQEWFENNNPYKCPLCDYRTNTVNKRSTHKWRTHRNKDEDVVIYYECPHCTKSFDREDYLGIHINIVHTKEITYSCTDCDFTAYSQYAIRAHRRQKHLLLHYKCFACDKNFTSRNGLDGHITAIHNNELFSCTECDKTFKFYSGFTKHRRSVHLGERYTCDQCGNEFTSKDGLANHVVAIHDKAKPYACDQCGDTFSILTNRDRHIRIVHEKIRKYSCKQCSDKFSSNADLKRHVGYMHSKSRDYKCTQCTKTFKVIDSLRRHVRGVHDNVRAYKCEYCESDFTEIGNLNKHIRNIHKKIPVSRKQVKKDANIATNASAPKPAIKPTAAKPAIKPTTAIKPTVAKPAATKQVKRTKKQTRDEYEEEDDIDFEVAVELEPIVKKSRTNNSIIDIDNMDEEEEYDGESDGSSNSFDELVLYDSE